MEQVHLGNSGLMVSKACLGTMTFGGQCDERQSFAILDAAADAGVTFLDTADVYPARGTQGDSEVILGRWLEGKRDHFVVASKCGGRVGTLPWQEGCSRKHIMEAVEHSLRRLGVEYLDLYQLHRFDEHTPIDESLAALDDLVHSGKVRYLGCSNWLAYQLATALGRSDLLGTTRFHSLQPRYNLLHRVPERELLPLCAEQGVGVINYNPLAGGLLTAKHQRRAEPAAETRFAQSPVYHDLYWHDREFDAVEAIRPLAADAGLSMASLALAWVLDHPAITSAIVGATSPEQLADSLPGADATLDGDLKLELDRITQPFLGGSAI